MNPIFLGVGVAALWAYYKGAKATNNQGALYKTLPAPINVDRSVDLPYSPEQVKNLPPPTVAQPAAFTGPELAYQPWKLVTYDGTPQDFNLTVPKGYPPTSPVELAIGLLRSDYVTLTMYAPGYNTPIYGPSHDVAPSMALLDGYTYKVRVELAKPGDTCTIQANMAYMKGSS